MPGGREHARLRRALVLLRPDQRVVGLRRVELHHLPDLRAARVVPLPLGADVQHPLPRRRRRTRRCPRRSRSGTCASAAGRVPSIIPEMSQPCTSPPEFAKYRVLPEIATEFSIDTSVSPTSCSSWSSQPGAWNTSCGATCTSPSAPVDAVELHDVDLAVLAALEQVVVEDEAAAVPVVVPQHRRHRVRGQLVELGGLGPVDRDDPEVVVARPEVDERVAVGVDGHRALDDVAGGERREDVLAGGGVDEVLGAVVAVEHDPRAAVPLEDGGLPRPAVAAPGGGLAPVLRQRAHRPCPGTSRPRAARPAPGPARSSCASGCRGT